MKGQDGRRARVAAALRDELSSHIARSLKDPRVLAAGAVSVNHVELNRDGSVARVFVEFVGADEETSERAVEGLRAAAGYLRGQIGREARMRRVPELRFERDPTTDVAARVTEIVRKDGMTPFERAAESLRRASKLLITCHRGPDGDSVGSMVALASLLREQGKEATLYNPDLVPRHLKWLPHVKSWVHRLDPSSRYDATVVVDCGDRALLGDEFPPPEVTGELIALDHHASARPFGDLFVSDPRAACVGVLVARLADHLGWPISPDAAEGLFVSLVSDTGSFRYANTDAEALRLAARLVEADLVHPWAVSERLHERVPLSRFKLLAKALDGLELAAGGRLAFMVITDQMVRDSGGGWDDTDGVVNYARAIDGVECGVLLTPAKGGGIRVSLRSKGHIIDAGEVAAALGGGGHPGAAGCRLEGTIEEARRTIEQALVAALDAAAAT